MVVATSHPIRRLLALGGAVAAAALALGACGGSSPPPPSTTGSSATTGASASPGRQVFATAGCEGCHTLSAVGSTGTIGPNLDNLKPSYAAVVKQVTNGGGGMPSFAGTLSKAQIDAVAKFVSSVTH